MIQVDPDWWQRLFDEVYLLTDAPFVCDLELTRREASEVERALSLSHSDRILDLCGGQGRHSLELARRGYGNVTVFDWSEFLLHRGRRDAERDALSVQFHQGDARSLPFPPASFDAVLLMANSFGYFADAADDFRLLAEASRVAGAGGRFLMDLIDHDVALAQFKPESWHEATDDVVVCWKREIQGDVICVREMVLSKATGVLRDRTYSERLYTTAKLHELLLAVGFAEVDVHRNAFVHQPESGTDLGLATNRMLVVAHK